MKKVVFYLLVLVVMSGCYNSGNGELVGVQGRKKFTQVDPYGMVYVPQGSYTMGAGGEDFVYSYTYRPKTVTIESFYMDETEITNNEYRQFVNWVRDSIARTILMESNTEYQLTSKDGTPIEYYDITQKTTVPRINWAKKIDWKQEIDGATNPLYEPGTGLFLVEDDRFTSRYEIDSRKLYYKYYWVDYQEAAKNYNRWVHDVDNEGRLTGNFNNSKYSNANIKGRSSFIKEEIVYVYPDTLCWVADFAYSYNEPMTQAYFSHPAYDDYPVVGVTWTQANAFCAWRTELKNNFLNSMKGEPMAMSFRLPTEAEWEYAARGGNELSPYPWGGPSIMTKKGCFLANFFPQRGNLVADGGARTTMVKYYPPNDYGLYDMAGNVAEWTLSAFDVDSQDFTWVINPSFIVNASPKDPDIMKRKVIKGGSWKDIYYFLNVSARDYQYQDSATSYIGFRCVQPFVGTKRM